MKTLIAFCLSLFFAMNAHAGISVGFPSQAGNSGKVLGTDGTNVSWVVNGGGGGSGTVTSVALNMPALFNVAGSPITTSGTFAVTFVTQSANTIFAGPTSGGAAVPTFRSMVSADLPDTAVTPATYTHATVVVDAKGRITSAANGTVTSGTVTSITAGTGLTGGTITTTGTIALDTTVELHTITHPTGTLSFNAIDVQVNPTNFFAIGGFSGTSGRLKLFDGANTESIVIKAPNALAGSTTYTLPPADGTSGQFLQTNGGGVLTWATGGGGGGATTELDNLTTTDINADFIFNTGGAATIKTKDNAGTNTEAFVITTGTPGTGFSSGSIQLQTASATGGGGSGQLILATGGAEDGGSSDVNIATGSTTTGGTGYINIRAGDISTGGMSNSPGSININGGDAPDTEGGGVSIVGGAGDTPETRGTVQIFGGRTLLRGGDGFVHITDAALMFGETGAGTPIGLIKTADASGATTEQLTITTGDGADDGEDSGNLLLTTGTAAQTVSGGVTVKSHDVQNDVASGTMVFRSGDAEGNNATGSVVVQSGDTTGSGGTGEVRIATGTGGGGPRGDLVLEGRGASLSASLGFIEINAVNSSVDINAGGTNRSIRFSGHMASNGGGTPTCTVDANAGTGATCTLTRETDNKGIIILTTGTGSTFGNQLDVQFGNEFESAPVIGLSPYNEAASLIPVWPDTNTTTDFTLTVGSGAPVADSTEYRWSYLIIQ